MKPIYYLIISLILLSGCKDDKPNEIIDDNGGIDCATIELNASTNVKGFSILNKLPGIWNGTLFSPTPLGSYPEWIVDFRPISSSQVSAKNELDSENDIFMSFFLVKHECEYKIAFRNGGGFAGQTRNSYLMIDSLNEGSNKSYYRFSDPIAGKSRVYTELTFKQDSLIMHVYTNSYNTLSQPQTHMIWRAKLKDQTATQDAINLFNYPQKQLAKDFSTLLNGSTEAIYYSEASDPYPEGEQPYLGNSTVNINISNPTTVDVSKKVLISITTQPLFPNNIFNAGNLKYRSRYVFINAEENSNFNFNYMHPGTYYVNAIYDSNGDFNFSSGDYMNFPFDIPMTLDALGSDSANVNINYVIP